MTRRPSICNRRLDAIQNASAQSASHTQRCCCSLMRQCRMLLSSSSSYSLSRRCRTFCSVGGDHSSNSGFSGGSSSSSTASDTPGLKPPASDGRPQQQKQLGGHSSYPDRLLQGALYRPGLHPPAHHRPEQRQQHPSPALQTAPMQQFELVQETAVYQRYLSVYNRQFKFCAAEQPEDCRVLNFDVVGHPRANFCFAVTFPFHPYTDGRKGGEVTLIREFAQGPGALTYCLPTGGLDPARHADLADCAARELSEEAWLAGGQWHRLLPPDHAGLPEVKWCLNRFVPFLVVGPQQDPNPGSRDAEEAAMEVLRVPLPEFRRLMLSGEMLLPSITTAYMAMDKLQELGLL